MRTYEVKSRVCVILKECDFYILYRPLKQGSSEWQEFLIEVKAPSRRPHFILRWNGLRFADNRELRELRNANSHAERWAAAILESEATPQHTFTSDQFQQPMTDKKTVVLWAEARKRCLTETQQACHAALTDKLEVSRYKLLWHVPLSQLVAPECIPSQQKYSYFRTRVDLVLLDKEYDGSVEAVGVDVNSPLFQVAKDYLRPLVPIFHEIDWNQSSPCERLLAALRHPAETHRPQEVINEPEFKTKMKFEEFLTTYMQNAYFDNTLSRMEVVSHNTQTKSGWMYRMLDDIQFEPSVTPSAQKRLINQKMEFLSQLDTQRNPLKGFYFLHEFSLRQIIADPPGIATEYDNLSAAMHRRLYVLAKRAVAKKAGKDFDAWLSGQDHGFARRRLENEKRQIFEKSCTDSKELIKHVSTTSLDIMILDPKAEPLLAVEFDGRLHKRKEQQDKDWLKDRALSVLGVPSVRISSDYPIAPTQQYIQRKTARFKKQRIRETREFVAYIFYFLLTLKLRNNETAAYERWVQAPENISTLVDDHKRTFKEQDISSLLDELCPYIQGDSHRLRGELDERSFLDLERWQQEIDIQVTAVEFYRYETNDGSPIALIDELEDRRDKKLNWIKARFGEQSVILEITANALHRDALVKGSLVIQPKDGGRFPRYEQTVHKLGGNWTEFVPALGRFVRVFLETKLLEQAISWAQDVDAGTTTAADE